MHCISDLNLLSDDSGVTLCLCVSVSVFVCLCVCVYLFVSVCVSIHTGSHGVQAHGKMLEVKSSSGKLLFSANDQEVVVGAERLRVMGKTVL